MPQPELYAGRNGIERPRSLAAGRRMRARHKRKPRKQASKFISHRLLCPQHRFVMPGQETQTDRNLRGDVPLPDGDGG